MPKLSFLAFGFHLFKSTQFNLKQLKQLQGGKVGSLDVRSHIFIRGEMVLVFRWLYHNIMILHWREVVIYNWIHCIYVCWVQKTLTLNCFTDLKCRRTKTLWFCLKNLQISFINMAFSSPSRQSKDWITGTHLCGIGRRAYEVHMHCKVTLEATRVCNPIVLPFFCTKHRKRGGQ